MFRKKRAHQHSKCACSSYDKTKPYSMVLNSLERLYQHRETERELVCGYKSNFPHLLPTLLFHHVGVEWEVLQLGGFRTPTLGHRSAIATPNLIHASIASSSTVCEAERREGHITTLLSSSSTHNVFSPIIFSPFVHFQSSLMQGIENKQHL